MTVTLPEAFKQTMAGVPTPVSVVTTMSDSGPQGTTVSSWSSQSLDPPMALVSLNGTSRLLSHLRLHVPFGINILAAEQSAIATTFAGRAEDRFGHLPWRLQDGSPRLADTAGWLACVVVDLVPGGDHVIVLGKVVAADSAVTLPLTYHDRRFGTHVPFPSSTLFGAGS